MLASTRYFIRILDRGHNGVRPNQTVEATDEAGCRCAAQIIERTFGGSVAFSVTTDQDGTEAIEMLGRFTKEMVH